MNSELLLGVDVEASSTKGRRARPDGEAVATAEGVWWKDFVSVCRELLEKADAGWSRIAGTVEPDERNCEVHDERRGGSDVVT